MTEGCDTVYYGCLVGVDFKANTITIRLAEEAVSGVVWKRGEVAVDLEKVMEDG